MEKTIVYFSFIFCTVLHTSCARNNSEKVNSGDKLLDSVIAAKMAIGLYNRDLDESIPWMHLSTAIEASGLNIGNYSERARSFVSTFRHNLLNAFEKTFQSNQKVLEWTIYAANTLKIYLKTDQKEFLIRALDDGAVKLNESVYKLNKVSTEFGKALNELDSLSNQLKEDFEESSSYYQDKLNNLRSDHFSNFLYLMFNRTNQISSTVFKNPIDAIRNGLTVGIDAYNTTNAIEYSKINDFNYQIKIVKNFYKSTTGAIQTTLQNIRPIKKRIAAKIRKMKTHQNESSVLRLTKNQKKLIKGFVIKLIAQCNEYNRKHQL